MLIMIFSFYVSLLSHHILSIWTHCLSVSHYETNSFLRYNNKIQKNYKKDSIPLGKHSLQPQTSPAKRPWRLLIGSPSLDLPHFLASNSHCSQLSLPCLSCYPSSQLQQMPPAQTQATVTRRLGRPPTCRPLPSVPPNTISTLPPIQAKTPC